MVKDAEEWYLGKDGFSGLHNVALTFVNFPLTKVCLPEIQTCPHVCVTIFQKENLFIQDHTYWFFLYSGLRF